MVGRKDINILAGVLLMVLMVLAVAWVAGWVGSVAGLAFFSPFFRGW
ncbi:MAG: hypothetical protein GDA36_04720 [Rhodobacteraceae bacterium]|nr:hypothetical protein [Paracoccaceae bacterium]